MPSGSTEHDRESQADEPLRRIADRTRPVDQRSSETARGTPRCRKSFLHEKDRRIGRELSPILPLLRRESVLASQPQKNGLRFAFPLRWSARSVKWEFPAVDRGPRRGGNSGGRSNPYGSLGKDFHPRRGAVRLPRRSARSPAMRFRRVERVDPEP